MRRLAILMSLMLTLPVAAGSQAPAPAPSFLLGQGRPETPGITRTTLKDDAKSTVTRVHFEPGAFEPPHTHPYDVILVPVTSGPVDAGIGDTTLTTWKAGDVQFVPKNVTHHVGNKGTVSFELIAIALK